MLLKEIKNAVRLPGAKDGSTPPRTFGPGEENLLEKELDAKTYERLKAKGAIVGKWKVKGVKAADDETGDEGEEDAPELKPATAKKLEKAGITGEQAFEMGADELKKIGLTAAQIAEVREVYAPDDETGDEGEGDEDGDPDDDKS